MHAPHTWESDDLAADPRKGCSLASSAPSSSCVWAAAEGRALVTLRQRHIEHRNLPDSFSCAAHLKALQLGLHVFRQREVHPATACRQPSSCTTESEARYDAREGRSRSLSGGGGDRRSAALGSAGAVSQGHRMASLGVPPNSNMCAFYERAIGLLLGHQEGMLTVGLQPR